MRCWLCVTWRAVAQASSQNFRCPWRNCTEFGITTRTTAKQSDATFGHARLNLQTHDLNDRFRHHAGSPEPRAGVLHGDLAACGVVDHRRVEQAEIIKSEHGLTGA